MSLPASESTWVTTPNLKQSIYAWLARRRIALSLVVFTTLIAINVLVVQNLPRNPWLLTDPLVVLADGFILLGVAMRTWSAGTLNKSREITASGPYALVRNPLYIGSFMLMLGFCILTRDMLTLMFIVGPLTYLYWNQVRQEEQRLAVLFPAQWSDYAASVPRFLPYRFSLAALQGWTPKYWWLNREYQALGSVLVGLAAVAAWHQWIGG